MKVFVVGATGVLGRALLPLLRQRGDTVVALVRSPQRAQPIAGSGVEVAVGDLLTIAPEQLAALMHGCDAAVHIATAIRPGGSGGDRWEVTGRLRTEGTRRLLEAALAAGVPRYVQQSIVMTYPDGGDRWLDESTPLDTSSAQASFAAPVVAMEGLVRAQDPQRLAWTILRGGLFVGAETGQEEIVERLRAGTLTVRGDGANYLSMVHVGDMATAVAAAIERAPAGSVFNVVDEPIRQADYLDRLAALIGVAPPPRDPTATPQPSCRCSNHAAREQLGWQPAHGIWPTPGR